MQPNVPPALAAVNTATIQKTYKLKTTWGIICLVGPTALVIISIIAYAILNFIAGSQETTQAANNDLFSAASPSPLRAIGNVLLFLVVATAAMTWLPGIIIGIILLSTRQKV